jgi:hypothetical protein
MPSRLTVAAALLAFLVPIFLVPFVLADDAKREDPRAWPRTFEEDGVKFTLYQPQLEKWEDVRLLARAAVAVAEGDGEPTYGVVWFAARTSVDKESRLATLDAVTVPRASFPSAAGKQDTWLAAVRKHIAKCVQEVGLELLETSLAAERAKKTAGKSIDPKNDVPRIFLSSKPSLLLLVDGKPVLRRVPGSQLLRVINTRALVLEDEKERKYYLCVGAHWLEAPAVEGPWRLSEVVPDGAATIRLDAIASKEVELYQRDEEVAKELDDGHAPEVFASTEPAELVETAGEPELVPIEGTTLVWVKNTDASVFFNSSTEELYVLVSGRWFRASSREGPWNYVAPAELPADFAKIPETDPASEVLSSVPGTPQADEALIANGIPQTATVKRGEMHLEIVYDGEPSFEPIEGTEIRYAVNTPTPVLLALERYYACEDGVWLVSPAPEGPWVVADSVPTAFESIPPTCPLYNCGFVKVFEATADTVYVGYTPGYLGTCVGPRSLVWGTGYRYKPWIKERWFGRPWTYGFAVGMRWNAGRGWTLGFGTGTRLPITPWWKPFLAQNLAFEPIIRIESSPVHVNFNNANVYSDWQQGVVVRSTAPAGPATRASSPSVPNDVYAAPDGSIFRRSASGWDYRAGSEWQTARAEAETFARQAQLLESERRARERVAASPHEAHETRPGGRVPPGLGGGAVRHR